MTKRHRIRLIALIAALAVIPSAATARDLPRFAVELDAGPVQFVGELYQPGVPTEATYQFNSWRLSYRYRF